MYRISSKILLLISFMAIGAAYAGPDKSVASIYNYTENDNFRGDLYTDQTYIWYLPNHSLEADLELQRKIGWTYPPYSLVQQIKNYKDGRKGFDVLYEINKFGLRINERQAVEKKHLIIVGESNVFGVGLNEQETLTELLKQDYPQFHTYNFGHGGGGPHNSLALMEKTSWEEMIHEKSGQMIYIYFPAWMHVRAIGSKDYLAWDGGLSPWYEIENEVLVNKGTFQNRFLTKVWSFIRFIDRFHWVGELPKINSDHMKLVAKIFQKMQTEYLKKFPEGSFTVAFSEFALEEEVMAKSLKDYLKSFGVEVVTINAGQANDSKWRLLDNHFNYKGQKMMEKEVAKAIKL